MLPLHNAVGTHFAFGHITQPTTPRAPKQIEAIYENVENVIGLSECIVVVDM